MRPKVKLFQKTGIIFESENKIKKFCSKREDFKRVIKTFSIIFWSFCFLYQSSQLISIYMSRKTVVENRVEGFKYSQIPAVTVCLPTFINVDKFAKFIKGSSKPEFQKLFKEYVVYNETDKKQWKNKTEKM